MSLPRRLDLLLARRLADVASPGLGQATLAHLIGSGAYKRQLRRTAVELRRRRRALVDGLRRHCGERVRVQDSGAGMHLVAWLPALIDAAAARGVGLHGRQVHYAGPPPGAALLLAFAGVSVA